MAMSSYFNMSRVNIWPCLLILTCLGLIYGHVFLSCLNNWRSLLTLLVTHRNVVEDMNMCLLLQENISSRFSLDSEANTSELLVCTLYLLPKKCYEYEAKDSDSQQNPAPLFYESWIFVKHTKSLDFGCIWCVVTEHNFSLLIYI